jgi:hypothetical protein
MPSTVSKKSALLALIALTLCFSFLYTYSSEVSTRASRILKTTGGGGGFSGGGSRGSSFGGSSGGGSRGSFNTFGSGMSGGFRSSGLYGYGGYKSGRAHGVDLSTVSYFSRKTTTFKDFKEAPKKPVMQYDAKLTLSKNSNEMFSTIMNVGYR